MFKVWSIIILGVTMLGAGMAVMSIGNRGATDEDLRYTGTWQCMDGSGERAEVIYAQKGFDLRIAGAAGNTLVACVGGNWQDGHIVFRNMAQDSFDSQEPCAYVSIKASGDRLIIDGYSAGPRVFARVYQR